MTRNPVAKAVTNMPLKLKKTSDGAYDVMKGDQKVGEVYVIYASSGAVLPWRAALPLDNVTFRFPTRREALTWMEWQFQ